MVILSFILFNREMTVLSGQLILMAILEAAEIRMPDLKEYVLTDLFMPGQKRAFLKNAALNSTLLLG